ncbi:MAG: tRNA epoxyqueuosine(34) reductase QueG [Methylococcales bacterium]|nr:tRNA epoxyqueuosine(34) reductase QueG [Methylococcales bacterium]
MNPCTPHTNTATTDAYFTQLAQDIKTWGRELGFQQVGITDTDLAEAELRLEQWLAEGYQGKMHFMTKHGKKRSRPALLLPGTQRIITCRMDYQPEPHDASWHCLDSPAQAFISRYALGRDYHKVLRQRLKQLTLRIQQVISGGAYRVFVDSAPVLEKPIAEKAGLGWIGKHSNVINRNAGSWFFLGEVYTDLPLPVDAPARNHCGACRACIDICPTRAIVAPYQVDARRCISYLTIELDGPIPEPLRPGLGNRIYGCDDCQLICPWNRFAKLSVEPDFAPRAHLNNATLLALFAWDEDAFLHHTEGSAIRRIGHARWQRNLAVALGNAPQDPAIRQALSRRLDDTEGWLKEHIAWALARQTTRQDRSSWR